MHDRNRPPPLCQYKRGFETWVEAEAAILGLWHYPGVHLRAYRCATCGLWHNRRKKPRRWH